MEYLDKMLKDLYENGKHNDLINAAINWLDNSRTSNKKSITAISNKPNDNDVLDDDILSVLKNNSSEDQKLARQNVKKDKLIRSLQESFKQHCLLTIDEVKFVPSGTISDEKILVDKRKWD